MTNTSSPSPGRRWKLLVAVPIALVVAGAVGLAAIPRHPAPGDLPDPLARRRYVPLEGTHNLRDLGGYETADGRHVRWGRVFRSDQLDKLTDEDRQQLTKLGLREVVDFRVAEERAASPSRLPTPGPTVVELPMGKPDVRARIRKRLLAGKPVDMVGGYRAFVSDDARQLAKLFRLLGDDASYPVLFHCTAGKDRTGVAAAFLLRMLGVPLARVYDDYLLTNDYIANDVERTVAFASIRSMFRMKPDDLRGVLEVRREYLDAAFDEIRKQSGSFEAYRRDALGVSDDELRDLRARLLTDRDEAPSAAADLR